MSETYVIANTRFNHLSELDVFRAIEKWNETVWVDDTVYLLGDVFGGELKGNEDIIQELNGYKIARLGTPDYITPLKKWKEIFDETYTDDILLDGFCLSSKPIPVIDLKKLVKVGIVVGNVHGSNINDYHYPLENRYYSVQAQLMGHYPLNINHIKKAFKERNLGGE